MAKFLNKQFNTVYSELKAEMPKIGDVIEADRFGKKIFAWKARYPDQWKIGINSKGKAITTGIFDGAITCFINFEPEIGDKIRIIDVSERCVFGERVK